MPITIIAKRDGHRRCNMRHPAKPTVHADGTFIDEQLAALKADPSLIVTESDKAAKAKPEGEALTAAIVGVIPNLDEAKDFTTSGTPKVKPVETALGYDVTADEVAAAWEKYQKDNA